MGISFSCHTSYANKDEFVTLLTQSILYLSVGCRGYRSTQSDQTSTQNGLSMPQSIVWSAQERMCLTNFLNNLDAMVKNTNNQNPQLPWSNPPNADWSNNPDFVSYFSRVRNAIPKSNKTSHVFALSTDPTIGSDLGIREFDESFADVSHQTQVQLAHLYAFVGFMWSMYTGGNMPVKYFYESDVLYYVYQTLINVLSVNDTQLNCFIDAMSKIYFVNIDGSIPPSGLIIGLTPFTLKCGSIYDCDSGTVINAPANVNSGIYIVIENTCANVTVNASCVSLDSQGSRTPMFSQAEAPQLNSSDSIFARSNNGQSVTPVFEKQDVNTQNTGVFGRSEPTSNPPVFNRQEPTQNIPVFGRGEPTQNIPVFGRQEPTQNIPVFGKQEPTQNIPTFNRSEAVTNLPTFNRSEAVTNLPTFNRSEPTTNIPTFGRSEPTTNIPTFGRSEAVTNIPTFGRSEAVTNLPTFNRSEVVTNIPTFGRSEPTTNIPTFGRSEPTTNIPTFGRSEPTTNIPTFNRSEVVTNIPTFDRSEPTTNIPTFNCSTVSNTLPTFNRTEISTTIPTFDRTEISANLPTFGRTSTTNPCHPLSGTSNNPGIFNRSTKSTNLPTFNKTRSMNQVSTFNQSGVSTTGQTFTQPSFQNNVSPSNCTSCQSGSSQAPVFIPVTSFPSTSKGGPTIRSQVQKIAEDIRADTIPSKQDNKVVYSINKGGEEEDLDNEDLSSDDDYVEIGTEEYCDEKGCGKKSGCGSCAASSVINPNCRNRVCSGCGSGSGCGSKKSGCGGCGGGGCGVSGCGGVAHKRSRSVSGLCPPAVTGQYPFSYPHHDPTILFSIILQCHDIDCDGVSESHGHAILNSNPDVPTYQMPCESPIFYLDTHFDAVAKFITCESQNNNLNCPRCPPNRCTDPECFNCISQHANNNESDCLPIFFGVEHVRVYGYLVYNTARIMPCGDGHIDIHTHDVGLSPSGADVQFNAIHGHIKQYAESCCITPSCGHDIIDNSTTSLINYTPSGCDPTSSICLCPPLNNTINATSGSVAGLVHTPNNGTVAFAGTSGSNLTPVKPNLIPVYEVLDHFNLLGYIFEPCAALNPTLHAHGIPYTKGTAPGTTVRNAAPLLQLSTVNPMPSIIVLNGVDLHVFYHCHPSAAGSDNISRYNHLSSRAGILNTNGGTGVTTTVNNVNSVTSSTVVPVGNAITSSSISHIPQPASTTGFVSFS